MTFRARRKRLVSAERRIRRYFLNFSSRPLGNYTPRQLRHAESYVIHVHSEIECYFEDMARFALDISEERWKSEKKATRPLMFLTSFYNEKVEGISKVPVNDIWEERARQAISGHRARLSHNHGIKSKNIVSLFAPVGFDVRAMDSLLLAELDSFGLLRGGYAHSSLHARAGATFDPFIFPPQAERMMKLIETFHDAVCEYIGTI